VRATVIGAQGFVGTHLVRYLRESGAAIFAPRKGDPAILSEPLGHVFYCAGLTADFRQKPFETVRAHVSYLLEVVERARYDSLLYLSSTRVYAGAMKGSENQNLRVNPCDPGDLYNLSKLTGEAVCLAAANQKVRIARLSNVYGAGMDPANFLASLIEDALMRGRIVLGISRDSAKDYVYVGDVVQLMAKIALSGHRRLYNIAAGFNVEAGPIIDRLSELTGCAIEVTPGAPTVTFPPIDIERIRTEFDFVPTPLGCLMEDLIADYRKKLETA
jgi:nucleoside-diphosphate-sugar epimerase